jgi:hypothetical protein
MQNKMKVIHVKAAAPRRITCNQWYSLIRVDGLAGYLWAFIANELLLLDRARTINLCNFHRCGKLMVPTGGLA